VGLRGEMACFQGFRSKALKRFKSKKGIILAFTTGDSMGIETPVAAW
jgi:hypothetical protein